MGSASIDQGPAPVSRSSPHRYLVSCTVALQACFFAKNKTLPLVDKMCPSISPRSTTSTVTYGSRLGKTFQGTNTPSTSLNIPALEVVESIKSHRYCQATGQKRPSILHCVTLLRAKVLTSLGIHAPEAQGRQINDISCHWGIIHSFVSCLILLLPSRSLSFHHLLHDRSTTTLEYVCRALVCCARRNTVYVSR